jgi:ABC-2 type transport system permease protein
VLLVVCAFPARIDVMHIAHNHSKVPDTGVVEAYSALEWICAVPQFLIMAIVLNFYLLDCLYAERKDRSILFWKSLPVSDVATVASKLLVALAVVPLGVYVVAILSDLLFSAIIAVRASFNHSQILIGAWDTLAWLKVQATVFVVVLGTLLWFAPLAALLLLVSAWARRSVFLWAALPPVIAIFVEWLAFGTHYVFRLIQYRIDGIWVDMDLAKVVQGTVYTGGHPFSTGPAPEYGPLQVLPAFANIDLWLGLAVAVLFTFAAVRIRRYRDDT